MSTYPYPFIAEVEARAAELFAESKARLTRITTRLSGCDKCVKKIEGMHHDQKEKLRKAELTIAEHKVSVAGPRILAAYKKLPSIELKLKVAEYDQQRKSAKRSTPSSER